MPSCCAPGCNSGYKYVRERHYFSPPKDPKLFAKWARSIPRANWELTPKSSVCDLHFCEKFLIKNDTFMINGETVSLPRLRWTLQPGAYPTIYPNRPMCQSKKEPRSTRRSTINKNETKLEKKETKPGKKETKPGKKETSPGKKEAKIGTKEVKPGKKAKLCKKEFKPLVDEAKSGGKVAKQSKNDGVESTIEVTIENNIRDRNAAANCKNKDYLLKKMDYRIKDIRNQLCNANKSNKGLQLQLDYAKKLRDDAVKQRDDALRQRDDAVKQRDYAFRQRDYALRQPNDELKQQDKILTELEELRRQNLADSMNEWMKTMPENFKMVIKCMKRQSQCQKSKNGINGMRYSSKYLSQCSLFLERSPVGYKHVRKFGLLPLPSPVTIRKMMKRMRNSSETNKSSIDSIEKSTRAEAKETERCNEKNKLTIESLEKSSSIETKEMENSDRVNKSAIVSSEKSPNTATISNQLGNTNTTFSLLWFTMDN